MTNNPQIIHLPFFIVFSFLERCRKKNFHRRDAENAEKLFSICPGKIPGQMKSSLLDPRFLLANGRGLLENRPLTDSPEKLSSLRALPAYRQAGASQR
jgi:hypothetical protein